MIFYSTRSSTSAEYWIHFTGGVHAFGYNLELCRRKWTDLDEIWSTPSTLSGASPGRFWALFAH